MEDGRNWTSAGRTNLNVSFIIPTGSTMTLANDDDDKDDDDDDDDAAACAELIPGFCRRRRMRIVLDGCASPVTPDRSGSSGLRFIVLYMQTYVPVIVEQCIFCRFNVIRAFYMKGSLSVRARNTCSLPPSIFKIVSGF